MLDLSKPPQKACPFCHIQYEVQPRGYTSGTESYCSPCNYYFTWWKRGGDSGLLWGEYYFLYMNNRKRVSINQTCQEIYTSDDPMVDYAELKNLEKLCLLI